MDLESCYSWKDNYEPLLLTNVADQHHNDQESDSAFYFIRIRLFSFIRWYGSDLSKVNADTEPLPFLIKVMGICNNSVNTQGSKVSLLGSICEPSRLHDEPPQPSAFHFAADRISLWLWGRFGLGSSLWSGCGNPKNYASQCGSDLATQLSYLWWRKDLWQMLHLQTHILETSL